MDWVGWATFGVIATMVLTAVLALSQLIGWTRFDLPLALGSAVIEDLDRARAIGLVLHVVVGQVFAAFYAAGFAALDRGDWVVGAAFGAVHAVVALLVLVPALPTVHPRMASERAGPDTASVLEPPGPFGLNYGITTPVVAVIAHVAYGIALGLALAP